MQIAVEHPAFQTERLAVEIAGLFSWPQLLVNGSIVEKQKGCYSVRSDSGVETPIELKRNFFDPVPKMMIGNEPVKLARSFSVLEYIWFVFLVISFQNSPIPAGGLVGALAAIASARVFRGNHSLLAKFGLIALITFAAFVASVIVAILLRLLNGAPPH